MPVDATAETALRVPGRAAPLRVTGGEDERSLLEAIAALDGRYEGGVMRLLQRLLGPGQVMLDAGAHIGIIAMAVAAAHPGTRIHAMEPFARTADLLEANIAANGIANVEVHREAIAATTGTLRFASNDGFSAGAHIDDRGNVEIRATTLDDWVARRGLERLDLVKADIEGSEFALLEGGRRTLTAFRPALLLEVNPAALRRVDGRGPRELWRLLAGRYPHIAWIGRGGALVPLRSEDDLMARLRRHGLGDVLCTADRPGWGGAPALAGRLLEALPHRGSEYAVEPALRLRQSVPPPARMRPGARELLPVEAENRTGARLASTGPHPVVAAARWWDASGAVVAEGRRTTLRGVLRPGAAQRLAVELAAPGEPGEYRVAVALVQEHSAWLDDLGPESAVRFGVSVAGSA